MLVLRDNFNEYLNDDTYIALGSFDGLHMGHMGLIKETMGIARSNNAKSMVCTFSNHPLTVINKELAPKLLMDNETKEKILNDCGIDILNMFQFNKDFMKISADDFVINMIRHYNAKGFIIGFNYRFGYKNLGDINLLKKLSLKHGFKVITVDPVKYNGELVSSSKIRNVISEDGDMIKASKMLTRHFSLKGIIISGKKLGRTIGFPTINLDYDKSYILPRGGVYYTNVRYDNKVYKGITNIGYNPTTYDYKLSVETYILDFNKYIYGEEVTIYFINRIRDEVKFDTLDELVIQLNEDKNYAKKQNIDII
ncbi:bifunctional riboflavin kinase/FAD synthetase [Clostridium sp. JN-9]|uniref:bifunctional riboflavin kinase/FAD synthetase n=1 Tax=Clostridium sp. JN-9 TaxID=2507159 RepID=UPI000FFE1AD1|nr:bifunctional riboflavin kinase/FAD synthetase [Clostridium sp. JN-9]QAT40207.1 bifunctional riboflavin kinase/FAD synthetase [Clostridium sp. JN-9]